ncbi:MAG: amidase [Motiliproteus sp.]
MATQQHVLMSDKAIWQLSVSELSERLTSGSLTATALLDSLLSRIDEFNPALNAFVAMNPQVRIEAEESEQRLLQGRGRSPLEGIPVAIKDNINVRGMVTSWGSHAFAGGPAAMFDELPVARLRAAGMVILGKTNVPEFTLDGYTDNPVYGVTRNPWNTDLTPGGSSGGAVAAVAAGLAPCAVGTDGGGSIRRPASHTGLIGLKPSIGRIARHHGLPHIMLDFEVAGLITRTVNDAQLLYSVVAGPDARDRNSLLAEEPELEPELDPVQKLQTALRILYVRRFGDHPLDSEIAASVDQAAARLRSLGHEVTEGQLPFSLDFVDAFWPMLGRVAVGALFEQYPEAEQLASSKWQTMAQSGRQISAPRYLAAIDGIDQFRRIVTEAYQDFDIIMTPSAAALPWPAEQPYPEVIDGQAVGPRGHAIYTGWVNACGHPGLNLPSACSASGLPIGFQLIGRFGNDRQLLRLGEAYESVLPDGWTRVPVDPRPA